ncbi:MAG: hypothetical protein ABF242_09700 [Flavobacteriales bacterium]
MNTKKINTYALGLIIAVFITACGSSGNGSNGDQITTEIPVELSDNQKIKEYFESLELVIAEYVAMIEKITITGRNAENKGEEPNISDAFGMLTDVASSAIKMEPLLEKMDQLEKDAELIKEDLTQEEVEAFSQTYLKIMKRFYEMGKKLEEHQ